MNINFLFSHYSVSKNPLARESLKGRIKCYLMGLYNVANLHVHDYSINLLPNDKILDWSKFKAHADDKINKTQKIEICCWMGRKHFGKRRKCWLPAFSPFPKMFSNAVFFKR